MMTEMDVTVFNSEACSSSSRLTDGLTDPGAAVDVSGMVKQQLDYTAMSPLAGYVQRRHTVLQYINNQPSLIHSHTRVTIVRLPRWFPVGTVKTFGEPYSVGMSNCLVGAK